MGNLFLDQFSLLHFSVGVVAYFLTIKFEYWLLINLIFEFAENSPLGVTVLDNASGYFPWPGGKKRPDSLVNITGDIICAMLGWLAAYYLDKIGIQKGWYNH